MEIQVCNNLISTIKKIRMKDWHDDIKNNNIFQKIKELLIVDRVINVNEKLEFIVVDYKCQCIIIPDLKMIVYFCQMLSVHGKTRSRNTFLSQNFIPISKLAKQFNYRISISLNPYDLNKAFILSAFITNTIKELLTIEPILINNSLNKLLPSTIQPFKNLNDFLDSREKLRNKNKGNESTFLQINNLSNRLTIYGKLDGANGRNTFLICKVINVLTNQNIEKNFFNVTPYNKKFSKSLIDDIEDLGFIINDIQINESKLIERLEKQTDKVNDILPRDQDTFKANIIQKYLTNKKFDVHKCMCCNYIVESNLIASHIHRYTDILEEFKKGLIDAKTAAHLIVSGDNGFLLCPNQDKEFEKGQIYFDIDKKRFIPNEKKLSKFEFDQILHNIKCANFENIDFSEEFITNIKKHQKRIEFSS